jgi:mannose-6-phosphate isomerase-like protein (cupin superfamily)
MRILLLLSLLLADGANLVGQAGQAKPTPQPPAPTQPPPTTAKPAQPTPRRTPPSTRSGMAITVTDGQGGPLSGVRVEVMGATDRGGETNSSGQVNFPGMPAGNYRVRFSSDSVITFEREVVLRGGQVADVDVTLNPAPRKEPPPAPAAPAPVVAPKTPVGPMGQPQTLSLVDLAERELIGGREPRKDTLVACSGNTRSMLIQLNQPQAQRVYESAETLYYVIAGQGAVNVDGRDVGLQAGGYVSLPRGVGHSITRKGNRPLILLAILSGEPCDTAK